MIHAQPADTVIHLDAVEVEAYHVSGHLRSIPGSISVLAGKTISLSDGTNLAATLNTLPGVSMQSGTYATGRITIRGMGSRTPFNSNRIRAYLNDIPLTTSDGVSTPEEIDMQSLGRLEVVKGPSSALYGSGLGGSINLYTPVKNFNEGMLGAQTGSFNTSRTHLSGTIQRGNTHLWGSVSHLRSDGYRENNHYKRTSLMTTAAWKQPRWSLNYTLLLIGVNGGIPSSLGITLFKDNPRAAAPNWQAIAGFKKYVKAVSGITFTSNLSDRLSNRLTLFGKWNDSYERRPFNNLDDQSFSTGFRNKLSYHTQKTDMVLGTEWIVEKYSWLLDNDGVLLNENRENRYQLNIFAVLHYRPSPTLNLSLAGAVNHIRYQLTDLFLPNGDQSGRHKFPTQISPRFGVNYAPNDSWAFYASAGHGYSLPSPEETLLPEGDINPGIKPEQGFQYEVGTRLNLFDNAIGFDGTLYWIELNNLLVTKRITEDIFTGINAGKTRHQGIELLLRYRLSGQNNFPGEVSFTLSYTQSLNRFIRFIDDSITYDGNRLPGIPKQSLYLRLAWEPLKMLEIAADMQVVGDQYLNDRNTLVNPGYFLGNIKVTSQFRIKKIGTMDLYAGINNITGTQYASMVVVNALGIGNAEPRYYYPGLPRHLYAGVLMRF